MDILALLSLAKIGCCEKIVEVSSSELAKDLASSQQTASRRIKELQRKGYITRDMLPKGQRIKLTSKGLGELKKIHTDLDKIFKELGHYTCLINGEIISGMGEGRYYMSIPSYREQFTKKLGFKPYLGTLNLRLKTEEDVKARQMLQKLEGVEIKGFKHKDRTFGNVKCFKAKIDGIASAIIIPERTHHGFNAIEVIAPKKIRDLLKLKDGDIVTVKVET